jgi:transcriptional regulator with XRE-family HTH domain
MNQARLFRNARRAAGLTFHQVGEAAGLDRTTIANYEARRAQPSEAALVRWQKGLAGLLADREAAIRESLSTLNKMAA